jgi:hypothetical protein
MFMCRESILTSVSKVVVIIIISLDKLSSVDNVGNLKLLIQISLQQGNILTKKIPVSLESQY